MAAQPAKTSDPPAKTSDSVTVAVRVRPLSARDKADGARECLRKVAGEPQLILGADRAFRFDHVFEPGEQNGAVFDTVGSDLVNGIIEGFNCTVFAYGQTGSGKTHTMGTANDATAAAAAPDESSGLIPRTLAELFTRLEATGTSFKVKASFAQIYKEEVHDLLSYTEATGLATLPIREDTNGGITLTGQQHRVVRGHADAVALLAEGGRNRATGATSMNATSSRSHAVFTLSLELRVDGKSFTPKMHFVDLAGSERAKRTGASGERLQEGIQINKGLLALGNVINALCENQHHVPYRDSKLTRLLQDSLGGNSRTVMLACVSPSDADLEETLNTLKYASRARFIKNKAVVVQDPMQARISELEAQVASLQARLTHYENGGAPLPAATPLPAAVAPSGGAAPAAAAPAAAAPAAAAAASRAEAKARATLLRRCETLEGENATLRAQLSAAVLREGPAPTAAAAVAPGTAAAVVAVDLSAQAAEATGEGAAAAASTVEGETVAEGAEQSAEEEALAAEQLQEELEYVAARGEMDAEMEGLNKVLQLKQAILQQAEEGGGGESAAAMSEALKSVEAELLAVTQQREALAAQMEALQRRGAAADAAKEQQHAKQLEALTEQIRALKKKHGAQEAQLRARQAVERRVGELQAEVDGIKAHKVALARKMREAQDSHRAQRLERDREIKALRRKGERTAAQLSALQLEHTKQAAVLKRKQEEVAAAQKRIRAKDATAAAAAAAAAARRPTTAPLNRPRPPLGGGAAPSASQRSDGPWHGSHARPDSARGRPGEGGSGASTARDGGCGGGGGGGGGTSRAEETVSILGAKPREWLENEVSAAVSAAQLKEQLERQVELRRQVARKLAALEASASDEAAGGAAGSAGAGAATAEATAGCEGGTGAAAEGCEALRLKRDHHTAQIRELSARLLQAEAAEPGESKLEALSTLPRAKALLKVSFARVVQTERLVQRKEEQLVAGRQALSEAAELAESLRAQLKAAKLAGQVQLAQVQRLQATLDSRDSQALQPPVEVVKEEEESEAEEEGSKMSNLESRLQQRRAQPAAKMAWGKAAAAEEEEESEAESSEEESEEEDDDEAEEEAFEKDQSWSDTEEAIADKEVRRSRRGAQQAGREEGPPPPSVAADRHRRRTSTLAPTGAAERKPQPKAPEPVVEEEEDVEMEVEDVDESDIPPPLPLPQPAALAWRGRPLPVLANKAAAPPPQVKPPAAAEAKAEAKAKPAPPVRKALGKLDVNGTMPTVSHPKGGLKPGAAINVNLHQDKDAEAKAGKRKLLNPLGKAFA